MSNDSTAGCPKCAGLAACWCPPLSPIALDVSAIRWGIDQHDQENRIAPALVAKLHLLCAEVEQLRAIVARVAQEEREKYEGRIKELETALRPFADLAGSSEGFCSPQSVGERMWCNNHRAAYNEAEGECDVVKADKVLRGTP